MKIHVERIPASGLEATFEVPYTEFEVLREMAQAGDCVFLSPVVTSFKAIRVRDVVEVKGRVHFSVRLNCSRCLNEFETVLKNDFAVAFVREIPEPETTAGEILLKDEDMGLIAFFGDQIDLLRAGLPGPVSEMRSGSEPGRLHLRKINRASGLFGFEEFQVRSIKSRMGIRGQR